MKVYELIAVLMEAPAGMDVLIEGSDGWCADAIYARYDTEDESVYVIAGCEFVRDDEDEEPTDE